MIDLGSWLSENYRVPVSPEESDRDGVSDELLNSGRSDEELPN